jgi:hypothetical protein
MTCGTGAGRAQEQAAGEKIGIARIRLRLPVSGTSVVVSDFFEADRALTAWKLAARPINACEYTIQFTDGVSLRGKMSSSSKKPVLPSLWRVTRIVLGLATASAGLQVDHAMIDPHGNRLSEQLLEHYSLERS